MRVERKIVVEERVPCATARIIEYRWRRGATPVLGADRPVLHRRSRPAALQLSVADKVQPRPFGDLSFLPPHIPISTCSAPRDERMLSVTCRFDTDWFSRLTGLSSDWAPHDIAQCCDLRNARLDQGMQWLKTELSSPSLAMPAVLEAIATLLAVELARHFSQEQAFLRVRTEHGKILPSQLRRILDYINDCDHGCPTATELSQLCNISTVHLRRAFRNTTGITLHDYIQQVRLDKAKVWLARTDMPIKAIASRLWFSCTSVFTAAFHKAQGETPSEFRLRSRH